MKKNIKKLIPAYILSFTISFMIYIYEPIVTYSTNINDFWFDLKTIIGVILLCFCSLFLLLSIIYTIIYFVNKCLLKKIRLYRVVLIISYILFIFIYIQGNYLTGNLPYLDGTTINWSGYTKDNIISLAIILVLIIVEIIAIKKFNYKKVLKVNNFVVIAIFFMLVTSFVTTLVKPGLFKEKIVANATIRNINNASSDKNFFIFLVDAVDSIEFASVVEESSEYSSTFDDFTYYPDTVSAYLYTRDSIPFIFSGKWNENKTEFSQYCDDAFSNSALLKELKEQEYQMNFYEYQINWSSKKATEFSNVDISNKDINKTQFFKAITKYALFKYLPYSLKSYSKIETVNFDYCKINQDSAVFNWSNEEAYNNIKNNDIEVVNNKYFQFIHIEGGHVPFDYDENVNKIPEEEGTYRQKLKATLNIIDSFINRLKESNVYDNSVIIVMADHGYWAAGGRQNPILYIKGIDEHHEMKTSDIPVSYEDLCNAYLELLKGNKTDNLFKDIPKGRVRRFIENAFKNEDKMIEYEQTGKAWDTSSIVATGREFNR